MGHANPTTTDLVDIHRYAKGDHDDEMAALGARGRTDADLRRQRDSAARLVPVGPVRICPVVRRVTACEQDNLSCQ